jgi:hypothetical protein
VATSADAIPASTASNSDPFEIGRFNGGTTYTSGGAIDDVRIYNRALNTDAAKEVNREYHESQKDDGTNQSDGGFCERHAFKYITAVAWPACGLDSRRFAIAETMQRPTSRKQRKKVKAKPACLRLEYW